MNPRHRRLVIPVALVALLLVGRRRSRGQQMSEPLLRALKRMRDHLLDPDTLVGGRVRPPARRAAAVAPGRAALRRPQGRPAPAGHGVRRDPGAHPQPRASATPARTPSTSCWTSRSATGTSRRPPRRQQLRVTKKGEAVVHRRRAPSRPSVDREPRPGQGAAAARGRPGVPGARADRRAGPDEAEPAGEVPPGRGVPADAGRLDHRGDRQGPPAPADGRGAAAGRRPRLRQRLPDLRRRAVPRPRRAACRCT